ncbi:hypothetical protein JOF29_007008 [Kribbella aluminosa]|uniref:Uncharacterized protein n=1 Tax=Kribbella aluminosa TaxID=416017 RepID=A0ABS4UWA4_9ACTN|nr:hypothetical protein [Kribbella aluminosa]MBP2355898.1 hypothetical protein [Kribbella aluminosa]
MHIDRRLAGAIAGIVTAAGIAIPAAALTSGSTPSPTPAARKSVSSSQLTTLAKSAGMAESRLTDGLIAAKRAGGNNAAGIAAFAASTGVPRATAERIVYAVFGARSNNSLAGPVAVSALANRLGVPVAAAQRALDRLDALSHETGSIDPKSTAFAGIAKDAGVRPAQLAAALDTVKRSLPAK